MKAWNRNIIAIATATSLTIGFGAVASADTIDLGYGQYANTSNGVHATKVEAITTDTQARSAEQNKLMQRMNDGARKDINGMMKERYPSVSKPFTGQVIDGYSIYQLSGDSHLGHNTGWLVTYHVNKDVFDYVLHSTDEIINHLAQEKELVVTDSHNIPHEYTKSDAIKQLQHVRTRMANDTQLAQSTKAINTYVHSLLVNSFNKAVDADKSMLANEKQSWKQGLTELANNINIGVTKASIGSYQSKYGSLLGGHVRGNLQYDGFKVPSSMSAFIIPTDHGVTVQVLESEDTSHDYWAHEMQSMYGLTALNGGK